jgi:hypothetical protein
MTKKHKFPWYGWVIAVLIGFAVTLFAATTPNLSDSSNYGVLSSTFTDTSAATTVNGSVGFITPPATAILGTHTNYGSGSPYSLAGTDQATVLGNLNSQVCDFTFGSATDLSLLSQPLTAGVYCVTGAVSVGTGGITLLSGTYIFRSTGALNTVANSAVSGGDSCDIFWTPVATTLGANSTFKGTVIDDAGITVGANTTWNGRALAFGGTITTDTDTITVPSCISTPPTSSATTTPPVSSSVHIGGHKRCDTPNTPTCVEYFKVSTSSPTFVPGIPNTGIGPSTKNWLTLIGASIALLISTFLLARGEKKNNKNKPTK